jgi:hypothetical protein
MGGVEEPDSQIGDKFDSCSSDNDFQWTGPIPTSEKKDTFDFDFKV